MPPATIRKRLITSTVLAVLLGYGVLLVARSLLTIYTQGVNQTAEREVQKQSQAHTSGSHRKSNVLFPINEEQGSAGGKSQASTNQRRRTPVTVDLPDNLGVDRDAEIPASNIQGIILLLHKSELWSQLLVVAAAGVTTLLTSLVMRPVLTETLDRPIENLSRELTRMPIPPEVPHLVAVEQQPLELQPIAISFNALQQRLVDSWSQERNFVERVAHELRTPITLIHGYAQRLQREYPREDSLHSSSAQKAAITAITMEVERMNRLVQDLLDLARDEAGHLFIATRPLEAEEVLLDTYERLEPLAEGRLRLLPPEDGAPIWVQADPDRLQQCLANLLDNALRYTTPGTPIDLFLSASAHEAVLHVRDHGPGVPPEERARIFERFVRGSTCAGSGGSGIGLALVRLFMERMGGQVLVQEAADGGADFQLCLPRIPQLESSESEPVIRG